MAKRESDDGVFKIGTATVAELRAYAISDPADQFDTSELGAARKSIEYAPGLLSCSLTLYWDETDTNGQATMIAGDTAASCTIYPTGVVEGEQEITFGNVKWGSVEERGQVEGWLEKSVQFSADSKTDGTYTTS